MAKVLLFFIVLVITISYLIGGAIGLFEYDLFSLFKKDEWIGFFYQNKSDLASFTQSPVFSNLDECRKWTNKTISELNLIEGTYSYECGKNCTFTQTSSSYTCKEILK